MSYFSDIFRLEGSRWYLLLGFAFLIAVAAGLVIWYGPRYNDPPIGSVPKTAPISVTGLSGTVTITCECPAYLIAQQTRIVNLQAVINLAPPAKPVPSARAGAASTGNPTEAGPLYVGYEIQARTAGIDSLPAFVATDADVLSKRFVSIPMSVSLKPQDADSSNVVVFLQHYKLGSNDFVGELARLDFTLPVRIRFNKALEPVLYSGIIFVLALVVLYSMDRKYRLLQEQEDQRLQAARTNALDNPDQASPAWELAGANLQRYFTRNLAQVRQVFYVSVGVMMAGFAFVLYGVYEQITWQSAWLALNPRQLPTIAPPTWIASVSGLITQFIGATFMVIYRSTMAQANGFVTVLDRINTVGLAMKVLDQIPDADANKNAAREQLIHLLLSSSPALTKVRSGARATKQHGSADGKDV